MAENEIKEGDVVVLKSDYEEKLKMTVSFIYNEENYSCVYIDPISGKTTSDSLSKIVLKKAKPNEIKD